MVDIDSNTKRETKDYRLDILGNSKHIEEIKMNLLRLK